MCDTGRQPEGWTEKHALPCRFRGLFSSGALVSPVPLSSANFKQGVFFMIDFRIFAKEKSFRLGLSAPGRSIVRDSNDYRTDPQNELKLYAFHFERLFLKGFFNGSLS